MAYQSRSILLPDFSSLHLTVLGDLMVDEYLRGIVRRISPEGPVVVVEVQAEDWQPGGAANVAANVRAMGASSDVIGLVGEDEMGARLRESLGRMGVGTDGLTVEGARPTTRKTRIVAHSQQVVRVDRETTCAPNEASLLTLVAAVKSSVDRSSALLVSDYRKGCLTAKLAEEVMAYCRKAGKPVYVNPKPSSASWFRGAAALSLNHGEAEALLGPLEPPGPALKLQGEDLRSQLGVQALLITLGPVGLACWTAEDGYTFVEANTVEVYDVAGAGDTTMAAFALSLAGGSPAPVAAMIANHAGACAVRKTGVAAVTYAELARAVHAGTTSTTE